MVSKRRTLKALGLALVAVLAFSAVAAGSASAAPRWKVNGAFLGAGVTKSFTATSSGTIYEKIPGVITFVMPECTETGTIVGSGAGLPGTKKEVVITCKGVYIEGAKTTCSVFSPGQPAGTIISEKLKSTLTSLKDGTIGEGLGPEVGVARIWTRVNTGTECQFGGEYEINGEMGSRVTPVGKEETTGLTVFPVTPIGEFAPLMHAGVSAVFSGSLKFSLTTKEKIGVALG